MNINTWLKIHKNVTLNQIRNQRLSDTKWNSICKEYERYCALHNIKVDYDLFDQQINKKINK